MSDFEPLGTTIEGPTDAERREAFGLYGNTPTRYFIREVYDPDVHPKLFRDAPVWIWPWTFTPWLMHRVGTACMAGWRACAGKTEPRRRFHVRRGVPPDRWLYNDFAFEENGQLIFEANRQHFPRGVPIL